MNSITVPLGQLRAGDIESAGGKGANLGELFGRGFPVPPGFVVMAQVSRALFDGLGVDAEMNGLEAAAGDDLARRCSALHRRIVETELPALVAAAILQAHAALVEGREDVQCAVRSSATAEDLAGASFAGQHGTYYYVGADRLLEMIRRCFASLWSPEAVSYRTTHGIPHGSVSMAVVVQEMVRSDVSGVAFTANPVTGDRGCVVIESSWGMGAAIVDGRVTPDRYVLGRERLEIRERRVAAKRLMVPTRLSSASSERLVSVPHEKIQQETLAPHQARAVAECALRCEAHFGAPQDVEWALEGGQLHLLQSRPITSLDREEIGHGVAGRYVLFKPLAENFTDPLTPFTADLMAYALPPGIRLIGGRVYADFAVVRSLVPLDLPDEDLAELLYRGGEALPPGLRIAWRRLPLAVCAMLGGQAVLAMVMARTSDMPDDIMDGYRALCRRVEADPALDPVGTLLRLWLLPGVFDPIGNMVLFVNVTSVRFAPWIGAIKRMLRAWLPNLGDDAVARLCSGSEGVLSAEMGRGIALLAREASLDKAVRQILLDHTPEEALARLRAEPAACSFILHLDRFLAVHGHRALKEFELQSARWEENPAPVLGMIRNYLGSESAPDHDRPARARRDLEEEIRGALGPRRWWLVRFAAKRARYYLKLRENSRFYHIMGLGVMRKKALALEAELRLQGRLKCKDDIFYLHCDEAESLRAGRLGWLDVEDRIRERRLLHVRLSKMKAPRTIGIERRAAPPDEDAATDLLMGQPASPGRYEGIARVILDPSVDATLRPGEVLVAPYTDPGWTPLFLTAGAAVVEVGSYLSHAGTVAREFGMPCVVDVADCTRRIQTGMRVEVDGTRGVVRLLGEAS